MCIVCGILGWLFVVSGVLTFKRAKSDLHTLERQTNESQRRQQNSRNNDVVITSETYVNSCFDVELPVYDEKPPSYENVVKGSEF